MATGEPATSFRRWDHVSKPLRKLIHLTYSDFADPPPNPTIGAANSPSPQPADISAPPEPIIPQVDPPTTLVEWAVLILNTPNPTLKVNPFPRRSHLVA